MDNTHIIEGCIKNDRKSQEILYKEYFPSMINMCMRYVHDKDRAAEIVNDGFLKVFSKISQFENRGSLEGWIRRIVFHSMSDNIKKNANYLKFMVFDDHDRKVSQNVLDRLYEEDIMKLVELVPPASGEVFILYAIEGFSHKEIAERKGISIGTSKWHLSEARKKLKTLILKTYTQHQNAG